MAAAVCLLAYAAALRFDAFESIEALARAHEGWQADELLTALFISPFGLAFFAWRRCQEVRREALLRARAEAEARHLAAHDPLTGLPAGAASPPPWNAPWPAQRRARWSPSSWSISTASRR